MRRSLLLASIGPLATAAAALAQPDTTGCGWRPTRIDLDITVQPDHWSMQVKGELTLELTGFQQSTGPTIGVNMRAPCVLFESVESDGARVELNALYPKLPPARLAHVRFAEPRQKDQSVKVRFACAVPGHDSQVEVTPEAAIASWTSAWYPIPFPGEDEGLQEVNRAPGTMVFHLPKGWSAVTGGSKLSHQESDTGVVETWDVPGPIARSFAAGPYRTLTGSALGVPVSVNLITSESPYAQDQIGACVKAVDALQEKLGPYPFPGFSIAEVPMNVGDFGASSEQGFIMVKPNFLDCKGGNLALFAHEAAHAWWGNTVGTRGQASILCDESLAQYGAVIAIEKIEGPGGVHSFLDFSRESYIHNQCAKGYFDLVRSGKDIPLATLKSGGINHTLSDSKGHWVYHMLRARVGDEVFFQTLRALIKSYSGRAMSIDDLRAAFIRARAQARLDTFFAQWLDRAGAPVLDLAWRQEPAPAGHTRVFAAIKQTQPGEPFDLDLDIALESESGPRELRTVRLIKPEESFEWDLPAPVRALELDPDHKVLIWRDAYGNKP